MSFQRHGSGDFEDETDPDFEEIDGSDVAEQLATAVALLQSDSEVWGSAYAHAGLMAGSAETVSERAAYAAVSKFLLSLRKG